jgi:putative iron-dependent peroxidase
MTLYSQSGLLSDPNTFAEYLTFSLNSTDVDAIQTALSHISVIEKSIRQKDSRCFLSILFGVSANAWSRVFPTVECPKELRPFPEMKEEDRHFPSTAGDLFFMIKSERMDLNFQCAKYLARAFANVAVLTEDIQGFKYLDNRDMIDFVDGTENPIAEARITAVVVNNDLDIHQGGSYVTVQRYEDDLNKWDRESTEYQEQVIGRSKQDDIEMEDDEKPTWAHNNKSKVIIDNQEIRMLRQNRPYGNAMEHGTFFIGFAASPSVIEKSLTQMIYKDENGDYDRLLDFVTAKTGAHYFVPSQILMTTLED